MKRTRLILLVSASLLLLAAVTVLLRGRARRVEVGRLERLMERVEAATLAWIRAGDWARADGFTYSVEVGQLMAHAARRRLEDLYAPLREHAVRNLILDDPGEPFTRGFVLWRHRPDTPPDASGTTEALRVAEGLWLGSETFGRPEDRDLTAAVIRGYARHAGVDQGMWMIRNYYNLGTRAFATNSYLVDYDVDFTAAVAAALDDARLEDLARRVAEVVCSARAPSGLIYDIIQPEVVTLMPALELRAFSPNDAVQLSNAVSVAERAAGTAPGVADGVLRFARDRAGSLAGFYLGRSGRPVSREGPGIGGYAALVRLAAKRADLDSARRFSAALAPLVEAFLENPREPRLYTASEILTALWYAIEAERS